MNLPSSISAKAINHNLNKTDKHVHHLNDSKLGERNSSHCYLCKCNK